MPRTGRSKHSSARSIASPPLNVKLAKLETQEADYLLKREALIGNERDEVTAAYEAEIAALEAAKNEEGRLKKQELAVKTYTSALQQQVDTLREQGLRAAAGLG